MKCHEELELRGINRCVECKCIVADDWQYTDFSNKTVTACPQCGETYHLEDHPILVVNKES